MRPPHYAGENNQLRHTMHTTDASFNEAPALRGGKPDRPVLMPASIASLQ